MIWINQPTVVMHIKTLNFLGWYGYIIELLYKTKKIISAYEIKFQFKCTNLYISKYTSTCMLYFKITSALKLHLCISTNTELHHQLNKIKFCFCCTKLFSSLSVTIFVTVWSIVVFDVYVTKTCAQFCLRHKFHIFFI